MPRIKTTNPRVRIVKLTGRDLSIEDVIAVANARPGEIRVEISIVPGIEYAQQGA